MSEVQHAVKRFAADRPLLMTMLVVSLAIHVAAATVFRVRASAPPLKRPPQPRVQFIGAADERALGLVAIHDPSLMALASAHGFSAPVFSTELVFPYRSPSLEQSPRPLTKRPAAPTLPPVAAATMGDDALAAKSPAASQENVAVAAAPAETRVIITPPLDARMSATPARVPKLEGPAPAQASVLRVAVDDAGYVRFALLEESSGSVAADRSAVASINGWRFAARAAGADGALQWGEVRIFWASGTGGAR